MLLGVLASWLFHPRCLHVDWADYFGGSLFAYLFVFKVESTMHLRLVSTAWLSECKGYWHKPAAPVQAVYFRLHMMACVDLLCQNHSTLS